VHRAGKITPSTIHQIENPFVIPTSTNILITILELTKLGRKSPYK
jgi:hypothetical protein